MPIVKPKFTLNTPQSYKITPGWIYAWVTIFALILITSIFAPLNQITTIFKLAGIVICLFYVVRNFSRDYFLLLAMFCTCLADIILADNNTNPIGIMVFIITQLLHLYRLDGELLGKFILGFTVFAIAILIFDAIFEVIPILFVACTLYVTLLVANVIASAKWYRREPKNPRAIFALSGFILFTCCDFCTGISYLSLVAVLPSLFYHPANFFVWLFYYPSQVLISNSSKTNASSQIPPKA